MKEIRYRYEDNSTTGSVDIPESLTELASMKAQDIFNSWLTSLHALNAHRRTESSLLAQSSARRQGLEETLRLLPLDARRAVWAHVQEMWEMNRLAISDEDRAVFARLELDLPSK